MANYQNLFRRTISFIIALAMVLSLLPYNLSIAAEISEEQIINNECDTEESPVDINEAEEAQAEIPEAEIAESEIPEAEIPEAEIPEAEVALVDMTTAEETEAENVNSDGCIYRLSGSNLGEGIDDIYLINQQSYFLEPKDIVGKKVRLYFEYSSEEIKAEYGVPEIIVTNTSDIKVLEITADYCFSFADQVLPVSKCVIRQSMEFNSIFSI